MTQPIPMEKIRITAGKKIKKRNCCLNKLDNDEIFISEIALSEKPETDKFDEEFREYFK